MLSGRTLPIPKVDRMAGRLQPKVVFLTSTVSNCHRSKLYVYAVRGNKLSTIGAVAPNYFVPSTNYVRKRGKVVGLGGPFIYENSYPRFAGLAFPDRSQHLLSNS
jgi:hypothetical protein